MGTDKGVKLDENKPRLDLVLGDFPIALWLVGMVGTFGAKKYTDKGWKAVDNAIERYLSALLRHYMKYKMGEEIDTESNLPHLAHLAWNALAVLEIYQHIKDCRNTKRSYSSVDNSDFSPKLKQLCGYKYDCHYKED